MQGGSREEEECGDRERKSEGGGVRVMEVVHARVASGSRARLC